MEKPIKLLKIKSREVLIIYFILSCLLVLMWFRGSFFIAGGEEGMPIYESLRTLKIYRFPWVEIGAGYPMSIYLPRTSFLLFTSVLEFILNVRYAQIVIFILLILTGISGVFLFAKLLTNNVLISFIAGLFYLFNLFTETQVWNRLLYFGMFAWAYLPLFLYLILKWIREARYKWLCLFLLSSLVFSNAFSHPPFILTLWFPAIILFLVEIIGSLRNRKKLFQITKKLLLLILLWTIINIWWIFPYVKISSISFSEFGNWKSNLDSLISVSQYFPTKQIILLRQSYMLGKDSIFYDFYSKKWTFLISYTVFAFVTIGVIASIKKKYWRYIFSIFFLSWFICKGTNPPFGFFLYKFLFSNFNFTQVLRNSYEKFGIVYLLPYSIFYAIGSVWLWNKFKLKLWKIAITFSVFISLFLLNTPLLTGKIFSKVHVEVPWYYVPANNYLNNQTGDGRILSLPIIGGDGVRYNWGYQGVEPGEFLFDRASISKILWAKYFDSKYLSLYQKFINKKDYSKELEDMGIKYLVLHNDLISEASGASTSAQVREILSKNTKISKLRSFGELEIYEYLGSNSGLIFTVVGGDPNPGLMYRKLSATRYTININNSTNPYTLIFKETYNDLWEARIGGQKVEKHFIANDYANGWEFNNKGSYTIDVVFKVWPWE